MFLAAGALALAFSLPLYQLVRFALQNDLYSHVILIPFISLYLVWIKRKTLPPPSAPARSWAILLLAAGAGLLAWRGGLALGGAALATDDSLALTTLSFVLLFGGVCGWFLGRQTLRAMLFPLGFLVFMVPFPVALRTSLETFLQHGSAATAYAFFKLSGMPVFREGMFIQLPGFSLEVAPQCSGIHSSLALFITSLLASHLFLRTPWKQATLAAAVIPLALLRNGLRIFTIGTLCVRIGPEMINSYIHRHGGPVFFVLSLVPFVLLLLLLAKSDRPASRAPEGAKD
jgi:exosortase C (VPDSG-CTERM-specific)